MSKILQFTQPFKNIRVNKSGKCSAYIFSELLTRKKYNYQKISELLTRKTYMVKIRVKWRKLTLKIYCVRTPRVYKSEYFKMIKIPPSLSENQKESEKKSLQYGITV